MKSSIVLTITMALQSAISMAALTVPVLAPTAAKSFGVPVGTIGIYVGVIYAGAMVSSLMSGHLVRRYGAIRISQLALVLAAAGLGFGLSASIWMLLLGAALIGLGYGVVTPASSHMLAQNTPPDRMGFVFSLKQTGVPLGGALAGLVLPPIVAQGDWRTATEFSLAVCLVAALLAQPLRHALDRDRQTERRLDWERILEPVRVIFGRPALRDLALASFVFAAMQLVLTGYLVTFLSTQRGLSLPTAGAILAMSQAAGVGGRLVWGWIADRFLGPRALLCGLAGMIALCAFALASSNSDWPTALFALVAMVFGGTAIGWNGVFLAEVARLVPRDLAGAATGGALFMTYAGVVAGPPGFAFLIAHGGYGPAFLIFAATMLVLAVFLSRAPRPLKP